MTPTKMLCATVMLSFAATMSAAAQVTPGAMSHESTPAQTGMKMSDADMRAMKACRDMPRRAMLKSKNCASMMKMHPAVMEMPYVEMRRMMACRKMSGPSMMRSKRCETMVKTHPEMMK